MAAKKNAAHSGHAREKRAGTVASSGPELQAKVRGSKPQRELSGRAAERESSRPVLHVPKQMREAKRWITWRCLRDQKTGKLKKVPYPAKGWNSPDNWHSLDDAIAATQKRTGLLHVGFVLGNGWAGLDVDGAWPEGAASTAPDEMREHGRKGWDACKGAYVERSPSGTGFKAFVHFEADRPTGQAVRHLPGGEHVGTECYAGGRWFAVTGDVMPDCGRDVCNVAARRGFVDLLRELRGPAADRVRAIEDGEDGLADIGAVRPHTAEREADLRAALSLLDANDRDTWIRYGMAIKAMRWDDDEAAFQLWHEWSATSAEYEGEAACRESWDGLSPRGDVSVASIFAAAKHAAGDVPATASDDDTLLAELSKPLPLDDYPMERFMRLDSAAPLQLLPNLLAPGLTLLQGRQKSGKTYMLLQLAVALATRAVPWGSGVAAVSRQVLPARRSRRPCTATRTLSRDGLRRSVSRRARVHAEPAPGIRRLAGDRQGRIASTRRIPRNVRCRARR